MRSSKRILGATILLCLVFAGACNLRRDATKRRYLDQGNQHFAEGRYREASLAYRKAIQKDPKFGEAYYRLALAELQRENGDLPRAAAALESAVRLLPDNEDAKVRLAGIHLASYIVNPQRSKASVERVRVLSQQILAKNPRSYDGLRFSGQVAMIDNRNKDALELFRKALEIKPMQPDVVLSLTQALFRDKQPEEAEKLALQLIEKNKTFGPVYNVLYLWYMSVKRVAGAEKVLKTRIASNPKDAAPLLQLAGHYFQLHRTAETAATLQRLLDQSGEFPNAPMLVGDFHRTIGDLDQALRHYEAGLRGKPQNERDHLKRIAGVYVVQGKKDQALKIYEQIAPQQPKDQDTRAARAALLLEKDASAAVQEFESLVKESPNNVLLRYSLGRAYLATGDREQAQKQFREATRRQRDFVPALLALAQMALDAGQFKDVLGHANEVLARDPKNPAARFYRAAGLTGTGNTVEARSELTRFLKDFPQSAEANLQLGLLDIAEKKYPEAEATLRKLHQSTGDLRALDRLIEVCLLQNQPGQAMQLANDALKKTPQSPPVRLMAARTALRTGNTAFALEQYRQLVSANPGVDSLHMGLGQAQLQNGDLTGAIESFRTALQLRPKSLEATMALAQTLEAAGKPAEAVGFYREALAIQPDNPVVMNNLAFLLAESGGDLDEALRLAQRALEKVRQQQNFTDTLGWIYLKKNMTDSALQVFGNLVQKYPGAATFRYHLGVALVQKGDRAKAKTELEAALGLKPSKNVEARIRDLIGRLG